MKYEIKNRFIRFFKENWLLSLIILFGAFLRFHHLGHAYIEFWDEIFHANVSKNLAKDFLKPALYNPAIFPYDYKDWIHGAYIWLHIPPGAFWLNALSFKMLGFSTFALRLPSTLLSVASIIFTYKIAKELFNKKVGLLASSFLCVNPLTIALAQGYQFGDSADITLLFWVLLSALFLVLAYKKEKLFYYAFAGAACGAAILTKGPIGFLLVGLFFTVFLYQLFTREKNYKKLLLSFILFIFGTIVISGPWELYAYRHYHEVFIYEWQAQTTRHISENFEGWGKPWDVYLGSVASHPSSWFIIIVSSFVYLLYKTIRRKDFASIFIMTWILGVYLPMSYAQSKIPAGVYWALPAILLMFSDFLLVTYKDKLFYLLKSASLFSIGIVLLAKLPDLSMAHFMGRLTQLIPDNFLGFPTLFQDNILKQEVVIFCIVTVLLLAFYKIINKNIFVVSTLNWLVVALLIVISFVGAYQKTLLRDERAIKEMEQIGMEIKNQAPQNTVLLVDAGDWFESLYFMFYSDKSAYPFYMFKIYGKDYLKNYDTLLISKSAQKMPIKYEVEGNPWKVYQFEK